MILVRDLINSLGLDFKFDENIIIGGDGPYQGCSEPMVNLSHYEVKSLTYNIVKPEESFTDSYVKKMPQIREHNKFYA